MNLLPIWRRQPGAAAAFPWDNLVLAAAAMFGLAALCEPWTVDGATAMARSPEVMSVLMRFGLVASIVFGCVILLYVFTAALLWVFAPRRKSDPVENSVIDNFDEALTL
ncbi:MAG: hypothetical protein HIU81_14240 [Acidobacteria bacterium]|nr:hypothetical protein [Acidobacteriota bacterium]